MEMSHLQVSSYLGWEMKEEMGMHGTNRDYDENWILNARKGVW